MFLKLFLQIHGQHYTPANCVCGVIVGGGEVLHCFHSVLPSVRYVLVTEGWGGGVRGGGVHEEGGSESGGLGRYQISTANW